MQNKWRWLTGITVCTMLVGCAFDSKPLPAPVADATPLASPQPLAACANVTTTVEQPAALPAAFPLPPGTVFTKVENRSGNRVVMDTVVPYDYQTTLNFLNNSFPKSGLVLKNGETEEGREAESDYEGTGVKGRWVLHPILDCAGAASLTILVGPGS